MKVLHKIFICCFIETFVCRAFMGGQQCPSKNNINGQVVVVTGASGGIGVEVCKELSTRNATIVMACRDMEKAEAAKKQVLKFCPQAQVEVRYLDLRSFDNVKRFVKVIGE
jgi:retinol dehydrogenase 13